MLLVCCGLVGILSCDVFFANWQEEISRKMGNTKVPVIGWQNVSKDTSVYWDIDCSLKFRVRVEGCPILQKRKGNYLWFWAPKV